MPGPETPGQEGPSFAPPSLPEGWIAQWDGLSKKYYFVQPSTGVSQWDTPQHAAPGLGDRSSSYPGEGAIVGDGQDKRGVDGPTGDRGLGSTAMNYAVKYATGGNKPNNHSNSNSSGIMGLAGQFLGGGKQNHGGSSGSSSGGGAGSIVGALAGSLIGKQNNQQQHQQQPNNYSGAPPNSQHASGGLMGAVTGMFGGSSSSSQGSNYGYSTGHSQTGSYSGAAPPASYQAPNAGTYNPPPQQSSHSSPPPVHHDQPSYNAPPQAGQAYNDPQHNQSYNHPPPPQFDHQQPQSPYGSTPSYSNPPPGNYNAPPPHQQNHGGPPQSNQGAPGGPYYAPQMPQQPYGGGYSGQPPAPQHTGNLPRPEGHHFGSSHEGGLYGNSSPAVSSNSRPPTGNYGPPGQFGGRPDGSRW